MNRFASRITQGNLDSDLVIENGNSVLILGITVSNKGGNTNAYEMRTDAGATLLGDIFANNESYHLSYPFIADSGVRFVATGGTGSEIFVTVTHMSPGA